MNVEDFLKTKKETISNIDYTIEKVKEKEDGVVIYLNNKEKISISVDNYFKYGLNTIKGFDIPLYEKLKNEERLFLAYRSVLRKLSIKDFTVKQIKDFLKIKKQLNSKETSDIIDKLINYDLLNDERYCQNRCSYLNKQLLSSKQIKLKLQKEGLDSEIIEKYVINSMDDEYVKAKKLADKYSNSIKNKSLNATKQAILSKIVGAGYSYDCGRRAINELDISVDNENELLKKEYIKAKNKYSKKYEDYDLRNHIYSYLVNKGFRSEDIKNVMEG